MYAMEYWNAEDATTRGDPAASEADSAHAIFFFFQAEDGIRDVAVTGVQTCALPISTHDRVLWAPAARLDEPSRGTGRGNAIRRVARRVCGSRPLGCVSGFSGCARAGPADPQRPNSEDCNHDKALRRPVPWRRAGCAPSSSPPT